MNMTLTAAVLACADDSATPYNSAKTMRGGLSGTSLITWQGFGHLVDKYNWDEAGSRPCLKEVEKYMKSKGKYQPVDGFTCRPSPGARLIEEHARAQHLKALKRAASAPTK